MKILRIEIIFFFYSNSRYSSFAVFKSTLKKIFYFSKKIVFCQGCVERKDLIDRLRLLYKSHNLNRRKENELRTSTDGPDTASNVYLDLDRNPPHTQSTIIDSTSDQQGNGSKPCEDDLCKICMDSLIDCVLLECGHMVSCTRCGKRLAECPICRQNVVRVVRVFKP